MSTLPPINRGLCASNQLLRLMSNLECSSHDASAFWKKVEEGCPSFSGLGSVEIGEFLDPSNTAMWEREAIFFWVFQGCAGGAGIGADSQGA